MAEDKGRELQPRLPAPRGINAVISGPLLELLMMAPFYRRAYHL